jgi:hypothetical protein
VQATEGEKKATFRLHPPKDAPSDLGVDPKDPGGLGPICAWPEPVDHDP